MLPRTNTGTLTHPASSLNIPHRTHIHVRRTHTLESTTRSAADPGPKTDVEEIQLKPVAIRQSQLHNRPETIQASSDEPHAQTQSLNGDSSAHSPAYHDLFKALTYSSLVLQNSGNLARDHLSAERTWLAYMRTGLLIAGTGVGALLNSFLVRGGSPTQFRANSKCGFLPLLHEL